MMKGKIGAVAMALVAVLSAATASEALAAEEPGYVLTPFAIRPGNVFPHGTRPEIGMELVVRTPGDFALSWVVRDAEGRIAANSSKETTASSKYVLCMEQARPGWYSVQFELKRDGRKVESFWTAFAQLGRFSSQVEPAKAGVSGAKAAFSHDPAAGDDLHTAWCARDVVARAAGFGSASNSGPLKGDLFLQEAMEGPRRAYVGVATAAHLLGGASGATRIDCGDGGVHLWAFDCGARRVYAMWTSRGTAELTCKLSARVAMVDCFGRDFKPVRDGGDLVSRYVTKKTPVVSIDERPRYFIADSDAVVSAVVAEQRAPLHARPKKSRLVKRPNDVSQWTLNSGRDPVLGSDSARVAGRYEMRQRFDTQMGRCLELELSEPNAELPETAQEYAVVELAVPITVPGSPAALGAWVKGNSGMGRFFLVVQDAEGRRCVSCEVPPGADACDEDVRGVLCNTGWTFLETSLAAGAWSGGPPKPPVKLVGFAFSASGKPLFPGLGRLPCRQMIQVGDICAVDAR